MANEIMSTTETSAIVPELWSARFRDTLRATLPFIDSVDRSYQEEIQDLGDILNISQIPDFDDATELSEGAAGDSDAVTVTGQQLVINKRPFKDVIVTKRAQLQSLPFMDQLRDNMIFSINKRIQQLVINEISPSTSAPDHVIAYDSGTTLALADIEEAFTLLNASNVPDDGARCSVLGANQFGDLFNINGFVSKDFIPAGSPLTEGSINLPILGFNVKLTTVAGDTAYLFHPTFLTLALQQNMNIEMFNLGVEGVRGTRINADVLLGVKQLDNVRVVTIS